MHRFFWIAAALILLSPALLAQVSPTEPVQVGPPQARRAAPPPAEASAEELERRGDEIKETKEFLTALDYYRAALKKKPKDPVLLNKVGICNLLLVRLKDARKAFEQAIKAKRDYADAYNNLGVVYYEQAAVVGQKSKYGDGDYDRAITQYVKAIRLAPDMASYYNNLGAAYFAKKDWDRATAAYDQAFQLDPDIFERTSHSGVSAQLSSPEDHARYDYVLAKLYAKAGNLERSLQYLRRSMEEGYKGVDDVYKDAEFTELRKDPRFTELMAARPPAIPE
jgi:Tfp pilus assembly protein PilF